MWLNSWDGSAEEAQVILALRQGKAIKLICREFHRTPEQLMDLYERYLRLRRSDRLNHERAVLLREEALDGIDFIIASYRPQALAGVVKAAQLIVAAQRLRDSMIARYAAMDREEEGYQGDERKAGSINQRLEEFRAAGGDTEDIEAALELMHSERDE